ncbi:3863_t:CDS:2, partial [Scutellospora calospora]
ESKYCHFAQFLNDLLLWKPVDLKEFLLTDPVNISATETTDQAKVNECVRIALDFEDLEIAIDLCEHNSGKPSKYDIF